MNDSTDERKFVKNEPVTHRDRHGIQHSYFHHYHKDDASMCVISDGNDCYESVKVAVLKTEASHEAK